MWDTQTLIKFLEQRFGRKISACHAIFKPLPHVLETCLTFTAATDALCKRGFTRSLAVPTTTLLASRLSNTSSVLSWPAAPGRGGKLDRPNSKLGDGGLGGGGGD